MSLLAQTRKWLVGPIAGGRYLFGDYCSGRVWALRAHGSSLPKPVLMADTSLSISSFGERQDDTLYVTDIGSGDIWAVVAQYR